MQWSGGAWHCQKVVNPQNTPYPKNFKPHFLENLSITFDQILHACRGACPLSVKEVSRQKLGSKFCTIPKCEISVRGAWPPNGGQMSRFLHRRFWVPPTATGWRRNFKNIFTQQCTNREKRKKCKRFGNRNQKWAWPSDVIIR